MVPIPGSLFLCRRYFVGGKIFFWWISPFLAHTVDARNVNKLLEDAAKMNIIIKDKPAVC